MSRPKTTADILSDAIENAGETLSVIVTRTEDGQIWARRRDGLIWERTTLPEIENDVIRVTESYVPWSPPNQNGTTTPLVNLAKLKERTSWASKVVYQTDKYLIEDFNPHSAKLWLNTPAGEIWIGPGESPEAPKARWTYITSLAPVLGETPMLDNYLTLQFPGQPDRVEAVKTALALMIRGDAVLNKILFAQGVGGSGKTTLFTVVARLLGTYSSYIDASKLMRGQGGGHEEWIADLVGKRLAVIEELPDGAQLNAARLKQLMSGGEMSSRRLRKDRFTFTPQFTMAIATNELPNVATSDTGSERRFEFMRMNMPLPKEGRFSSASDAATAIIDSEGPAILADLIRRCNEWDGEYPVLSDAETLAAIGRERSGVEVWYQECIEPGVGWTPTKELHAVFKKWARENHHADQTIADTVFAMNLAKAVNDRSLKDRRANVSGWKITPSTTVRAEGLIEMGRNIGGGWD